MITPTIALPRRRLLRNDTPKTLDHRVRELRCTTHHANGDFAFRRWRTEGSATAQTLELTASKKEPLIFE
jgi:hypothetical protein